MELKQIVENINREWNEYKETLAKGTEEQKRLGTMLGETEQKLAKINERIDSFEVKLQRAPAPKGRDGAELANPAQTKAFGNFLRKGAEGLTPDERKLMTVASDITGGFGATTEFDNEILKGLIDISPVRELVRVRTTGKRAFSVMKRTGTFAARRAGEIETRTETTGLVYGLEEVPTHEMYALVDISRDDLEDTGFDLEAELMAEFTEQFAVKEGAEFVSGTGVKQFEGILTNAAVSTDNSGSAAAITYDGLVDVSHNIKAGYGKAGRYIFNLKTLAAIRKLKDTTNQPLWAPMQSDAPSTILGFPYTIVPDMPDVAADAYPVAFGDFKRAFVLGDRKQIVVVRDDVTQLTAGAVRFYAYKRNGGQVTIAEAVRKLRCQT